MTGGADGLPLKGGGNGGATPLPNAAAAMGDVGAMTGLGTSDILGAGAGGCETTFGNGGGAGGTEGFRSIGGTGGGATPMVGDAIGGGAGGGGFIRDGMPFRDRSIATSGNTSPARIGGGGGGGGLANDAGVGCGGSGGDGGGPALGNDGSGIGGGAGLCPFAAGGGLRRLSGRADPAVPCS